MSPPTITNTHTPPLDLLYFSGWLHRYRRCHLSASFSHNVSLIQSQGHGGDGGEGSNKKTQNEVKHSQIHTHMQTAPKMVCVSVDDRGGCAARPHIPASCQISKRYASRRVWNRFPGFSEWSVLEESRDTGEGKGWGGRGGESGSVRSWLLIPRAHSISARRADITSQSAASMRRTHTPLSPPSCHRRRCIPPDYLLGLPF